MPKFEREIKIDAPVETVWGVITDPDRWSEWFPGVDSVSNVTGIGEGGSFEWQLEGKTGSGTIVNTDPQKRLEIRTRMGDDEDEHLFELRPSGGLLGLGGKACKVEYTLDTLAGGGILGRFIAGGNPKDTLRVKKAMARLKTVVEAS